MITLEISTHSGNNDEIIVEEYEAQSLAQEINDNETSVIAIGNIIYSKIDIKRVVPKDSA